MSNVPYGGYIDLHTTGFKPNYGKVRGDMVSGGSHPLLLALVTGKISYVKLKVDEFPKFLIITGVIDE